MMKHFLCIRLFNAPIIVLQHFFSLQSSLQNPYTHIKTYHSYNYTNNHIIDINKLTTSCTYLCTYYYACMPPLLTKSMWLCKRNYLIDRFMYLLCELYYHKMAQMMCLFVQKRYLVLHCS